MFKASTRMADSDHPTLDGVESTETPTIPATGSTTAHGSADLVQTLLEDRRMKIMGAHELDVGKWTCFLAPQLTRKALQAFAATPTTQSGSYADVKAAILRRYDINEETYQQRFRAATCKSGESYQELAVRLSDLLAKWMAKYKDDPQKVLEQIAIEQLINKLPRSVQIYVREHKPATVMKAGALADDYVRARRPLSERTPESMDRETQAQWKTDKPVRCQYCSSWGHTAKEMQEVVSRQTSTKAGKDCRQGYRQDRGDGTNDNPKEDRA